MTAIVERVARVFCAAADKDPDKPFIDRHGVTHDFPGWRAFEPSARAAIAAMREPTEGMIAAADGALAAWRRTLDRDEAMARSYRAHDRKFIASATPAEKHSIRFRAMIDAALTA